MKNLLSFFINKQYVTRMIACFIILFGWLITILCYPTPGLTISLLGFTALLANTK